MSAFNPANPSFMSILGQALRLAPRTAYKTAGRVIKDIGSSDPAVAKAAIRMVGMHAAGGAALGGVYGIASGQDIGRSMLRGGMAGAGFGLAGGLGGVNRTWMAGANRAGQLRFLGGAVGEKRMMKLASKGGNWGNYATSRAEGAIGWGQRAGAKADLNRRYGLFNTLQGKAMGGYNPWR